MYIGKDLLFPESDIYVLKNSETLQTIYSPIEFSSEVSFTGDQDHPVTFNYVNINNQLNANTLYVSGTSTFIGLITGTITKAKWS